MGAQRKQRLTFRLCKGNLNFLCALVRPQEGGFPRLRLSSFAPQGLLFSGCANKTALSQELGMPQQPNLPGVTLKKKQKQKKLEANIDGARTRLRLHSGRYTKKDLEVPRQMYIL